MTRYHYATVSAGAFFKAAAVPASSMSDAYLADDEESRAVSGLFQKGCRLTFIHEGTAVFEKQIGGVPTAVQELLEQNAKA